MRAAKLTFLFELKLSKIVSGETAYENVSERLIYFLSLSGNPTIWHANLMKSSYLV